MIGEQLEKLGWRQGSIIRRSDIPDLLNFIGKEPESELILIIASQSCDIANNNIELDPCVDISIARRVAKHNGNLTFNKNPRQLHSELKVFTEDENVLSREYIEIKAAERVSLPKEHLATIEPDTSMLLENEHLNHYVKWLASRYDRPALPTEFNQRVSEADPKGKLRKNAKGLNEKLVGIYVEIHPFGEISKDKNYSVNLLGLVSDGHDGDLHKVEQSLLPLTEILRAAKMDVKVAVRSESDTSIATIKRFKRFYFDDLSFKESAPLPPEVNTKL